MSQDLVMAEIFETPPSRSQRLAVAQRPGPGGSRVVPARKPSLPRLGDLSLITRKLRNSSGCAPPANDDDALNCNGSSSESPSSKASHGQDYVTPDSSPPTPRKSLTAGRPIKLPLLPLLLQLPQPTLRMSTRDDRWYQTNGNAPAGQTLEPGVPDGIRCQTNTGCASYPLASTINVQGLGEHLSPDAGNRRVLQPDVRKVQAPIPAAGDTAPEQTDDVLHTPSAFLAYWGRRCPIPPGCRLRNFPDHPTRLLFDVALVCIQDDASPQRWEHQWQNGVARYRAQQALATSQSSTTSHSVSGAIFGLPADERAKGIGLVVPPQTEEHEARDEMHLAAARVGKMEVFQKSITQNQPSPSATGVARSIRLEHSMGLALSQDLHRLYPQQSGPGSNGMVQEHSKADKLHRKLQLKGLLEEATPPRHVHIFVDMSNIFIGFEEQYRIKNKIHKSTYMYLQPTFFLFRQLAHLLERDRNVVKRKLAGSVANAHEQDHPPAHFVEAESAGYNTAKMLRVVKLDHSATRFGRRPQRYVSDAAPAFDWTTTSGDESGSGSGSPPVLCPRIKLGEQGVDENLHLAMQSSLVDFDTPGTMVLATGDAKEAEFSEGFAHYAVKAMTRGWNVEVVSWKRCLSSIWRKAPFADKYAKQFRIIELDSFYEDLLADWLEPSH